MKEAPLNATGPAGLITAVLFFVCFCLATFGVPFSVISWVIVLAVIPAPIIIIVKLIAAWTEDIRRANRRQGL